MSPPIQQSTLKIYIYYCFKATALQTRKDTPPETVMNIPPYIEKD